MGDDQNLIILSNESESLPQHVKYSLSKAKKKRRRMTQSSSSTTASVETSPNRERSQSDPQKENINPESGPKRLIVFDWDDTILPTTFIHDYLASLNETQCRDNSQKENKNTYQPTHQCSCPNCVYLMGDGETSSSISEENNTQHLVNGLPKFIIQGLDQLSLVLINIMTRAHSLGQIAIITNAEPGWVELTCKRFLPKLWPYIEQVPTVSARTCFNSQHSTDLSMYNSPMLLAQLPFAWKECAFRSLCFQTQTQEIGRQMNSYFSHVISIGDSRHERTAVFSLINVDPNIVVKSLKFLDKPSLAKLIEEHSLFSTYLDDFLSFDGPLDVCINEMNLGNE